MLVLKQYTKQQKHKVLEFVRKKEIEIDKMIEKYEQLRRQKAYEWLPETMKEIKEW